MAGGAGRPAGAPTQSASSMINGTMAPTNSGYSPTNLAGGGAVGAMGSRMGSAAAAPQASGGYGAMGTRMNSAPPASAPPAGMSAFQNTPSGQQLQQMQQMIANPQMAMMQRLGINRMPYNSQAFQPGSYASPRPIQNFQPQLRPQLQAAQSPSQADPEYQAWLAQRNSGDGGGGYGGGGN